MATPPEALRWIWLISELKVTNSWGHQFFDFGVHHVKKPQIWRGKQLTGIGPNKKNNILLCKFRVGFGSMTLGLANNIGRTAPKPIPTVAAELIQRK
jgi:hypothetical protein